jgi:soluble lytic murein transglycosylase-like protein
VQTHVINDTAERSSNRSIRRTLERIPVLMRAQLAMVALAGFVCTATVLLGGDRGVERTAFAVPAPVSTQDLWADEVNRFAKRLHVALGIRKSTAAEFSGWILEAAKRQGLSPEMLASVVLVESSFRKEVTSHMGAIGPAQVKPYWAKFCGSRNLAEPSENIFCGAQILAHFRDICGAEQCALSAYNVGLKNLREVAYFQEQGMRYARSIDRHMERIAKTVL